jgi:hypothetical protein
MFLFKKINNDLIDMVNVMGFSDFHDILDSAFFNRVKELPLSGVFTVSVEEHRPDLLAFNIYGKNDDSYKYWWVLMIYNDILLVKDLILGSEIRYPAKNVIDSFLLDLQ